MIKNTTGISNGNSCKTNHILPKLITRLSYNPIHICNLHIYIELNCNYTEIKCFVLTWVIAPDYYFNIVLHGKTVHNLVIM